MRVSAKHSPWKSTINLLLGYPVLVRTCRTSTESLHGIKYIVDGADKGLEAGDVGNVIHVYRDGEAYELEFVALDKLALVPKNSALSNLV